MLFKDMYSKPIDRSIDAVVKASSTDHLANELDEYVITPELASHLNRFFDEYNDPDATGNGAWISGFFGSGKSHLLKILAVVLQNQEVEGTEAVDYILPKLEDDPSLRGAMECARAKHPSESILFNIDTIAPNQGRTEAAALLAAFIKVFNRHCDYFDGDQQHIAKMEYDLSREGKLDVFKQEIADNCGKPWEDVRKSALIYRVKVTAAFDAACGNEPGTTKDVVGYYKDTYQPDIHSFAVRVKEYIDNRESGFRLNFFVDEVGQFIAQNVNLMVNLQSVAEELNAVCGGSSWVIVTSQENMEDIVGQMTERSANDFSKIQARFKIKMQLTSKDAKTVIKQRLLAKTREAANDLRNLYAKYEPDFRVLFDFADGSKRYKVYADEQDFIETYPFIPYQFDLFITAMRGLSDYNAFTGKHHSTGARSMLGVFQEVGEELNRSNGSIEDKNLATFDAMFEGLRNSLKSEVYGAISVAENNLSDTPMAIRMLKVLLLMKYCKDFRATPSNLRVLLYGALNENTVTLEAEIKASLAELERQLYIRRSANSNAYEYLTDEEKDIEKEIRNVEVGASEVREYITETFKSIVGAAKATYENGSFSYSLPYDLKIDSEVQGRSRHDLSLDIVTEVSRDGLFDVVACNPKTLAVILHDGNSFMNNVSLFAKTRKYVNTASGDAEVRQAIISDKRQANQKLSIKLRGDMQKLLTSAQFVAGGVDVTKEVGGTGRDVVASAMRLLIKRCYTGLQQMRQNFSDKDVFESCMAPYSELAAAKAEYVETVFNWISLRSSASSVTVGGDGSSSLTAHFTKNEYGWPEVAIRNAVAMLYAERRIEIRKSGSLVEGVTLATILKGGADLDKLVVVKMTDVSAERLGEINKSFRDLVGTNPTTQDAKSIANELKLYLDNELPKFRQARDRASEYPFVAAYGQALDALEGAYSNIASDWKWVAIQYPERSSTLVDAKKALSDMRQFMEGSAAAEKWRAVKEFRDRGMSEAKELGIPLLSDGDILNAAMEVVEDPECYRSAGIPRAAGVIRQAEAEIDDAKSTLRKSMKKQLEDYQKSFESSYDLTFVPECQKAKFADLFEKTTRSIDGESLVFRLKSFLTNFKEQYGSEIVTLLMPPASAEHHNGGGCDSGAETEEPQDPQSPRSRPTVQLRALDASTYGKPTIESQEDVDLYIAALRGELSKQVAAGNVIMR